MEPTKTTTKKKDSVPKIHAIERPKLSYQTSFTRLRFSKLEYEFFVATNVNVKLYNIYYFWYFGTLLLDIWFQNDIPPDIGQFGCYCTEYAQLFLLDTQHSLIFVR